MAFSSGSWGLKQSPFSQVGGHPPHIATPNHTNSRGASRPEESGRPGQRPGHLGAGGPSDARGPCCVPLPPQDRGALRPDRAMGAHHHRRDPLAHHHQDNITSLFGNTAGTRLADPAGDRRVYEWLLHETFDVVGNHSLCEYAADDPALYGGGDPDGRLPEIFERHRVASNRYPRRLYYGNLPEPLLDPQQRPLTYPDGTAVGHLRDGRRYAFEVVFDYGDWDLPTVLPHPEPPPADQQELFGGEQPASTTRRPVPVRADRFSHFRAGFEVRTLRRCRRILMFHHLAELGGPT